MNINSWEEVFDDLKFLACGPFPQVKRFTFYNINGFIFHTINREEGLKTQNNGVFPMVEVGYYGRLVDIIELNYHGWLSIFLFKCKWVNNN